jgi:hypothetical protein
MSNCLAQDEQIWYRKRVSHAGSRKVNREQRRRVIGESRDHTMCERVAIASNVVDTSHLPGQSELDEGPYVGFRAH